MTLSSTPRYISCGGGLQTGCIYFLGLHENFQVQIQVILSELIFIPSVSILFTKIVLTICSGLKTSCWFSFSQPPFYNHACLIVMKENLSPTFSYSGVLLWNIKILGGGGTTEVMQDIITLKSPSLQIPQTYGRALCFFWSCKFFWEQSIVLEMGQFGTVSGCSESSMSDDNFHLMTSPLEICDCYPKYISHVHIKGGSTLFHPGNKFRAKQYPNHLSIQPSICPSIYQS